MERVQTFDDSADPVGFTFNKGLVHLRRIRLRPKIPWIGVSISTPGGAGHFLRERYDAGGHRGESFTKHPGDMRAQLNSTGARIIRRIKRIAK